MLIVGVAVNSHNDIIVCVSEQNCVKVFDWSGAHKLTLNSPVREYIADFDMITNF